MALALARGNQVSVTMERGQLRRNYPLELNADEGSVAVEFLLSGGSGYLPLTVHGLIRYDGWLLERQQDERWILVDQSVHGNDFWQARYDEERGAYSLTWNLPNRGTARYRLRWSLPAP